ncbi:MAG TPA: CBS domain-containing protein [Steroidobacteraceae bacterium]|nr:CBS domain-containing protein [Steroidobacteraceae bacterium]
MSGELAAVSLLNERFLTDYPFEAARALEGLSADAAVEVFRSRSPAAQLRCWQSLSPDRAADLLAALPAEIAQPLLAGSDPQVGVAALVHLDSARREALLAAMPEPVNRELRELMQYRQGTAGYLMDPRIATLAAALSIAEAIERLRSIRQHGLRELFVVDEQMRLVGKIDIDDLVLTGRERPVGELARPVTAMVRDSDPVTKVAEVLHQQPLDALPVVDDQGRFKGVIKLPELMMIVRQQGRGWRPMWRTRGMK